MIAGDGTTEADAPRVHTVGLRERRHQRTARDLRDAALTLFEKQGFARTTVEQIASEAGVSSRTFFRYCATKEDALLLDEEGTEEQLRAAIVMLKAGENVLAVLERTVEKLMERLEEVPDDRARTVRMHRVVRDEPALVAASLREESVRNARLVSAITDITAVDVLTATAVISVLSTEMRMASDQWTHDPAGREISLADHFRASQTLVRTVTIRFP